MPRTTHPRKTRIPIGEPDKLEELIQHRNHCALSVTRCPQCALGLMVDHASLTQHWAREAERLGASKREIATAVVELMARS